VFGHGRLRLYLLSLLAERPRHGYDLIRELESRFRGRYAPSAGTVYPRLQRLEADGQITHAATGGRKVYSITEAGLEELLARANEVAAVRAAVASAGEAPGPVQPDQTHAHQTHAHQTHAQPPTPVEPASAETGPASVVRAPPGGVDAAADLERRATLVLDEVRRLTRVGRASPEAVRATGVVLDATLDQVRRLLL
jgi:DNA-binding PadR family transcriptional regulator